MHPCGFAFAGSLYYKMWAGLNGFDPRNNLALGGVRIGMGCMNLVTVISRYTRVPVTLMRSATQSLHAVREYYTSASPYCLPTSAMMNSILLHIQVAIIKWQPDS